MMSVEDTVSVQIQRAINDAIKSQVLRQIQNAIMAESGHVTQKGWYVPAERPGINAEVLRNEKARNNSKSELVQKRLNDESTDNAYENRVRFKYILNESEVSKEVRI